MLSTTMRDFADDGALSIRIDNLQDTGLYENGFKCQVG